MAVTRHLSTRKYLIAFVLSLLVFLGGVVIGMVIENARLVDARQITLSEKVNLRSLQLQQQYIKSGIADCTAINEILEANINELGEKIDIISGYEEKAFFSEQQFDLELRDYFLTEIQYFLLAEEFEKQCGRENVKVLYFYAENQFDTQGRVLDYLRKLFEGKMLVFSFNSAFTKEPMIRTLLASYNITSFPAVVVEEEAFQGFTSVGVLLDRICGEFERARERAGEAAGNIPEVCGKVRER